MEIWNNDIIVIIFGLLGVITLGVLMFRASRLARKKNLELHQNTNCTQIEATEQAFREGKLPFVSKDYWVGNLTRFETVIVKILAFLAIVFASIFLAFACYAVWEII